MHRPPIIAITVETQLLGVDVVACRPPPSVRLCVSGVCRMMTYSALMTKIIPASTPGRCFHGVGNLKLLPLTLPRAPLLDLISCDLVPLQHGCQGHGYHLGVAQGPVHA